MADPRLTENKKKDTALVDIDGTSADPQAIFSNQALLQAFKQNNIGKVWFFTTMTPATILHDLEAVNKARSCEVVEVTAFPAGGNYRNFPIEANSAYIRYGEQLFYLNKARDVFEEIPLTASQLANFDNTLKPQVTRPKKLSAKQFEQITKITNHVALQPLEVISRETNEEVYRKAGIEVGGTITTMDGAPGEPVGSNFKEWKELYNEALAAMPYNVFDVAEWFQEFRMSNPTYNERYKRLQEKELQASTVSLNVAKDLGYTEDAATHKLKSQDGKSQFDTKALLIQNFVGDKQNEIESLILVDDLSNSVNSCTDEMAWLNSQRENKIPFTGIHIDTFKPENVNSLAQVHTKNLASYSGALQQHFINHKPRSAVALISSVQAQVNQMEGSYKKLGFAVLNKSNKGKVSDFVYDINSTIKTNSKDMMALSEVIDKLVKAYQEGKDKFSKKQGGLFSKPKTFLDELNSKQNDHHYVRMVALTLANVKDKLPLELQRKIPLEITQIKIPDKEAYKPFQKEEKRQESSVRLST